jgi:uncharacterized protein YceK
MPTSGSECCDGIHRRQEMGGFAPLTLAVAVVLLLGGCRTIATELDPQTAIDRQARERHRAQAEADLAACRKVTLLDLGDDPFGPNSPDCTFVVWDPTMPGIQFEMGGNVVLLPKAIVDAAEAGGFHEVCRIGTNGGYEHWMRHLPPGQGTQSWFATMWTRAPKSERSGAACDLVLS